MAAKRGSVSVGITVFMFADETSLSLYYKTVSSVLPKLIECICSEIMFS